MTQYSHIFIDFIYVTLKIDFMSRPNRLPPKFLLTVKSHEQSSLSREETIKKDVVLL